MICTGLNKYITELSEAVQENRDDESGASRGDLLLSKTEANIIADVSSSPRVEIPFNMREWIDVEPGEYDQHSFEIPKKMTKLLRHDRSVFREEDGAVEFKIIAPMFAS